MFAHPMFGLHPQDPNGKTAPCTMAHMSENLRLIPHSADEGSPRKYRSIEEGSYVDAGLDDMMARSKQFGRFTSWECAS